MQIYDREHWKKTGEYALRAADAIDVASTSDSHWISNKFLFSSFVV